MKKNNVKKILGIFLFLLILNFFIPNINGHVLKTNNIENKNRYKNEYDDFSTSPKLADNFFTSNDFIYFTVDRYGIHNYLFRNSDYYNVDSLEILNFKTKQQKNNVFYENDKIDFGNYLTEPFSQKSGNILYVGGIGPNNYTKIQDAINDSENGDTVFVYDDSSPYYENIIINKSINLIGENKDTTEINGFRVNQLLDTINISADEVYLNGFSVNNNPGYYYQAAIKVLGDYSVITNCKIYNNSWIGISLFGSANTKIFGCELYNNLIAMYLINSDENEINNCYCYGNSEDIILFENSNSNNIINSVCVGNFFSGIHIQHSKNNQIINCTCVNGYGGIGLAYAPNTTLRGNILENNFENFGIGSPNLPDFYCDIDTSNKINGKPIYYLIDHHDEQIPLNASFVGLVSCTNISVKNLDLGNNFQAVVCAGSSNCIIENCNFINNEGHGIFLISSQNNTIKNCFYKNNFFSGIYLENQVNNNTILNNTISNIQVSGLWFEDSTNNKVYNNNIKTCSRAITLDKSSDNILRNNEMFDCGLFVNGNNVYDYKNDVDTSNKVNNKTIYYYIDKNNLEIPSDAGEVILINCTKCNVTNLDLSNQTVGVQLAFSSFNNITKNIINNNKLVAIDLDCSNNNHNTIKQNTLINNNYGIDVDISDYNTINGNTIIKNGVGISLDSTKHNLVFENDIQNSYNGIYVYRSTENSFLDNIIRNCDFNGIYLLFSKNNVLKNNKMFDCGLLVYGSNYYEYINDVDESNKINGKTIHYYIDQININVLEDAGEVILVNCKNCSITKLDLSNGTIGIELVYSSFITISKNTLSNNRFAGIYIESSVNNTVEKNTIKNNGYGIDFQLSYFNKIKNNNIQKNYYGFYVYLSDTNMFYFNNILYNNFGLFFRYPSNNNTVFQNNLINNGYNAWDENENTNSWFNRKKGNYWSDYKNKYPNAKKMFLKGVWDTAYEIPIKENKDEYPLIRPIILSKEKTRNQIFIRLLDKIQIFSFLFVN